MKITSLLIILLAFFHASFACEKCANEKNPDFTITNVLVTHHADLGISVWEITVEGIAGQTTPEAVGQIHGAPVMGYVFPTTLSPADVGFGDVEGILALALTSHPDFDDTPLWDENNDQLLDNDGIIWHPHWVILNEDKRVDGRLSVVQFDPEDASIQLPPTNPGMPMYMDSPGFQVNTHGHTISVIVPDYRMNQQTDFSFDAVACFMEVNTEDADRPMLGVYEVYHVASGDLSLPYQVKIKK